MVTFRVTAERLCAMPPGQQERERLRVALEGIRDLPSGVHDELWRSMALNLVGEALSGESNSAHETSERLNDAQCDDVIEFLADYEWSGLTRENVRTWDSAIASARPSVQKASESRFLCQHCGREFGTIAERGIHESACKAPKVPEVREWHFDRYRNGRPMAEGVKVRATTEAEARDKAKSLSISAGHWPSDELRLSQNGNDSQS